MLVEEQAEQAEPCCSEIPAEEAMPGEKVWVRTLGQKFEKTLQACESEVHLPEQFHKISTTVKCGNFQFGRGHIELYAAPSRSTNTLSPSSVFAMSGFSRTVSRRT